MFIAAIICLDLSSLQRMTYPTDQQGRHCTLDNSNYNYLYFSSSNDPVIQLIFSQKGFAYHNVPTEVNKD